MISGLFRRLFSRDTPPRQVVVPCEPHDREDFIRGAELLATLFLERARVARSIGAESEALEFAEGRVREEARTVLDRPDQTHYEWLAQDSMATLDRLRGRLREINAEMSRVASSQDPEPSGGHE